MFRKSLELDAELEADGDAGSTNPYSVLPSTDFEFFHWRFWKGRGLFAKEIYLPCLAFNPSFLLSSFLAWIQSGRFGLFLLQRKVGGLGYLFYCKLSFNSLQYFRKRSQSGGWSLEDLRRWLIDGSGKGCIWSGMDGYMLEWIDWFLLICLWSS